MPWKKAAPEADTIVGDAAAGSDDGEARDGVTGDEVTGDADAVSAGSGERLPRGSAYTPGKGRPTPKRKEAERRKRGPIAPPPTNRSEARARRKALKKSMSKEDRKAQAERLRQQRMQQREAMMAGDEEAQMPRDRGPVRRLARNVVDSRRNFAGLFLPFAIVLIVLMFIPAMAGVANLLMLAFVVLMILDSIVLGRIVSNRIREAHPDSTDTGFRMGWYAFTRAMQLRRMRAPRPQVGPGDSV